MEWTTDDLAMHSKYLKQQMKMILSLPWWFYVEERIMRKTKKIGRVNLLYHCV